MSGASGMQIAALLIVCIAALVIFGWIARDMWAEYKQMKLEEQKEWVWEQKTTSII